MNTQRFAALFPLGSHLCRMPMPPMAELTRDMETLKRQGFNLVKLQEHWAWDEPLEGQYDFGPYEELIAHAAALDMGVYLGLTNEQAPSWLYRKYPDCHMMGRNGVPVAYEPQQTLPADGKPGPCFDHPGALAAQMRFTTRLVQTLGRFENIVVWNTWQEIGYWSEFLAGTQVCYCDHTLAFFRQWLEERYGDLDALNRAWGTRYGGWGLVMPDRSARGRDALPQDIAWRYFMDNVQVAKVLRERCEAIKAADPLGRPVFAHKGQVIVGSAQDWTYSRTQDFLGSSAYPSWFVCHSWDDEHPGEKPYQRHPALLNEMWDSVALRFDYLRSAAKPGAPVWAAEFQGGPVSINTHKSRVPDAADIRRWMLTAVASGVTAISFWVTRVEIMLAECNGFGLLDSTGDDTSRMSEAGRVGRALQAHADVLARPSWPGADVAILIDELGYQTQNAMPDGSGHLPYCVRGWHRLLWDAGIPVDFIIPDDLDPARHKAVILPFPYVLPEATAAKLAAYVQAGGHLISEAAPGRVDEHAICVRGEMSPTLAALFGARQADFQMVREPGETRRYAPRERSWGEYLDAAMLGGEGPLAGGRLRAHLYIQTLVPDGGTPVLRHGDAVAGVMREVGQGTAWLLGTYPGHGGTAHRDAESRALLLRILALAGVRPAHEGELLLRRRIAGGKEVWFFTNPTDYAVTEAVAIPAGKTAADLLCEDLPREGDRVLLTVGSLDVRVLAVE
jgi:beta-galactosidase